MKEASSQRLCRIAELLQKQGYVKAAELAERYKVSMETIRKDLMVLEEQGVAKREYGDASLSLLHVERKLEYRHQHEQEKKEIARYASELLKGCHTLILDAGTTCHACVQYINRLPAMDIFTTSLVSACQLDASRHNVFLLPGRKREKNCSVIGSWTETYLKHIHADICLLGTSGLSDSSGPTAHSYQELGTKQTMIRQSELVYVLADAKKFYERGLHTVADWKEIDGIISDHTLSPKLYHSFCRQVMLYTGKEEEH